MPDTCPMYKWMNYGSYCSYYALRCPNCDQPHSWDGPCTVPLGCPQSGCQRDAEVPRVDLSQPQFHPDIVEKGLPAYPAFFDLNPGAMILNPAKKVRVRVVEFEKSPGQAALARLFLVRLLPKEFDWEIEPRDLAPIQVALGYEVSPTFPMPPHRSFKHGEVTTCDPVGFYRRLRVLITKQSDFWLDYHVVLVNPAAPGVTR
jgi:hypothetical protein